MTNYDQEETVTNSEVQLKIIRYEDKIAFEMRPQMSFVAKKRDEVYEELSEYLKLRNTLEMLQKEKLKKYEARVDIGCNIFVQTEAEEDIKN